MSKESICGLEMDCAHCNGFEKKTIWYIIPPSFELFCVNKRALSMQCLDDYALHFQLDKQSSAVNKQQQLKQLLVWKQRLESFGKYYSNDSICKLYYTLVHWLFFPKDETDHRWYL